MNIILSIRDFLMRQRYKWFSPKCIRLAVVGNASSGKSYLLLDFIPALKKNCAIFRSYALEYKDGFQYSPILKYTPNQKGGNGRTPLYACRQEDHYGSRIKGPDFKFDLSFLNIPGEIFNEEMLQIYLKLKGRLMTKKKLFTVYTYVDSSYNKRLIVKPNPNECMIKDDGSVADPNSNYMLSFKPWSIIDRELNDENYKFDSKRNISGKKLMLNFFKYDTDSVMRSIYELIQNKKLSNLGIDHVAFEAEKYDVAFVFFHYCTLATDIVLCDRVYTHIKENEEQKKEEKNEQKKEGQKPISFEDLTNKLSQFLDVEELASKVNVYLAFRNVDFLLQNSKVEGAYVDLNRRLKEKDDSFERCSNVIYSLFSYLMFDQIGYDMHDIGDSLEYILGLEEGERAILTGCKNTDNGVKEKQETTEKQEATKLDKKKESIDRAFIDKLKERYLDIEGCKDFVFDADSLEDHLKSRIEGFRTLLIQTGWHPEINDTFIPHMFFTSRPITLDYRVYRNGRKGVEKENELDFYHEGFGKPFSEANSHACFGSYQLILDIINRHNMGSFNFGALLQRVCNIG